LLIYGGQVHKRRVVPRERKVFRKLTLLSSSPLFLFISSSSSPFLLSAHSTSLEKQCIYLENEEIILDGIKIFGIPWIFEKNSEKLFDLYSKIPEDTDILITHAPPYGYGDVMTGTAHSGYP
jgi:hypothetical protein